MQAAPDEGMLAGVGAGPLEDLLTGYGMKFIERIEKYASTDAKFRFALAGVWKSSMSELLWQRVSHALGDQERYQN